MNLSFYESWCALDDEDHEEEDGRRRKKIHNTNSNVF